MQSLVCWQDWVHELAQVPAQHTSPPAQSVFFEQEDGHDAPSRQSPCAPSSGSLTVQHTWPCAVLQSLGRWQVFGQLVDGLQMGVL